MIIVVDACALAGEVVRKRGRRILAAEGAQFFVAEHALDEALRRLDERRVELKGRGVMRAQAVDELIDGTLDVLRSAVSVVSREVYEHLAGAAGRRIPADPDDWPTVAVAMLLNGAIWTEDRDFFGCGCTVWRTETLLAEVEQSAPPAPGPEPQGQASPVPGMWHNLLERRTSTTFIPDVAAVHASEVASALPPDVASADEAERRAMLTDADARRVSCGHRGPRNRARPA